VIHPDGNIWMVDVVESSGWWKARGGGKLGIALARDAGQSVDARVRQLTKAGCAKVFREVASGAKTDRSHAHRASGRAWHYGCVA
jgi:hypothetical protein